MYVMRVRMVCVYILYVCMYPRYVCMLCMNVCVCPYVSRYVTFLRVMYVCYVRVCYMSTRVTYVM